MARRRGFNTALGVGGALARGVDSFLNSYYRAKQFGLLEQAAKNKTAQTGINQGKLAVAQGNLGLRGNELGLKTKEEAGRNRRFDVTQGQKVFSSVAGQHGQDAPEEYLQAYGAMLSGDPNFAADFSAARSVAESARAKEAGRTSGARATAAAAAKSRQQKTDREQQFNTREALSGRGALPPPADRFYPAQDRTVTQEQINQRTAAGLTGDRIRRLRKMSDEQGGLADPRLFLSAWDELERVTGRSDLTEDDVADQLNIPSEARQELFDAARGLLKSKTPTKSVP